MFFVFLEFGTGTCIHQVGTIQQKRRSIQRLRLPAPRKQRVEGNGRNRKDKAALNEIISDEIVEFSKDLGLTLGVRDPHSDDSAFHAKQISWQLQRS